MPGLSEISPSPPTPEGVKEFEIAGGRRVRARGLVRLKACLIGEVEVLFRHTLSGL